MELKRGGKKREYKKNIAFEYSLGVLGLLLLISTAFLGPRLVFDMQDKMRCREIVTKSPEEVDITSFNTGYETGLYKRMEKFAAGLAEGEQYYVSVQDMEITSEIRDWLGTYCYDSAGFSILAWNLEVLPEEAFSYELLDWKRCVIYSDDFAGGVNFILWYMELGLEGNPVVKLLLDGETGDIYGVRTDFSSLQLEEGTIYYTRLPAAYGINDTGTETAILWEWCLIFSEYFGGLTELNEMMNYLEKMGYGYILYNFSGDDVNSDRGGGIQVEEVWDAEAETLLMYRTETDAVEYDPEKIKAMLQVLHWEVDPENGNMSFYFPYGENQLKLCFRLDGNIRALGKWGPKYMDVIFGFPEIYERVPAFMEN